MDKQDEILLDDSDDDFHPSPSTSKMKLRLNRKKIAQKDQEVNLTSEKNGEPERPARRGKNTINEEKVKSILSKVLNKSNSSDSPVAPARSSSLRGKENEVKTPGTAPRLTRSARSARSASVGQLSGFKSTTTSKKRNLTESWKKAQNQLTPTFSAKKECFVIDDDDEDDFVDEKSKKGKSAIKAKIDSVKKTPDDKVKYNENETVDSELDTTIELDEDIEGDLMKIDQLKLFFDTIAESNKSSTLKSQTEKVKRSRSISKGFSKASGKKKKVTAPVIIDRGPIDCFDDLITETTRGFPCNFCEKASKFNGRKEMIHHLQTAHDAKLSEEQSNRELAGLYTCDECGLMVHSKHVLRTHKKAHAKIKQEGCDNYYKYYLENKQTQVRILRNNTE